MSEGQQGAIFLGFMGLTCVLWFLRWFFISRHYTARALKLFGGHDGCGIGIVADERDRPFVLVWMEGNDDQRDLNALLTSSQARRLAEMLVIASKPGKTVADARRNARRK